VEAAAAAAPAVSDTLPPSIIFPSWQITTGATLLGSLVLIMLLGIAYEYVRLSIRTLDARLAAAHGLAGSTTHGPVHRRRASVLPTSAATAVGNGLPSGMRRTLSGRDEEGPAARRRGIM
jgi:copper transporter 1